MGEIERHTPGSLRSGDVAILSRDPAEACLLGGRVFHEHQLSVPGGLDKFAMRMKAATIAGLTAGWIVFDTEVKVESPGLCEAYQVNVLTGGSMRARLGDDEIVATRDIALVYRPDRRVEFNGWRTPGPLFGLKISRRALEGQLEALLGRPIDRPIVFRFDFDLTRGPGREWAGLARVVATAASEKESWLRQPMIAEPLIDSLLRGLLLAAEHDLRDELDAAAAFTGPSTIHRARAYIDEHADQPLTVSAIASHVGVSVRALQDSFRRSVGTSPTELVRHVRLTKAHGDLLASDPTQTTVAKVAARWGFHAGRFSADYRTRYGVFPSETLRRGR